MPELSAQNSPTVSEHNTYGSRPEVSIGAIAVVALLLVAQALSLFAMGSPPVCKCGHVSLWYANPSGPETSQQITDWYTFTHVLHGIAFYALTWLVAPRASLGWRLATAVGIEGSWEILENTPLIIDRYRQSALAQGYVGDSIINSVSDTLAATLGFLAASRLPTRISIALVLATEIFLAVMIRDNLTLNIIQIVQPSATLSRWQKNE